MYFQILGLSNWDNEVDTDSDGKDTSGADLVLEVINLIEIYLISI